MQLRVKGFSRVRKKNVEIKRIVLVTLVAATIVLVCLRTLLLLSRASSHVSVKKHETAVDRVAYYLWPKSSEMYEEEGDLDGVRTESLKNFTAKQRRKWIVVNLTKFQVLQSDDRSRLFSNRVDTFLKGLGGVSEYGMSLENRWPDLEEGSSDSIAEQKKDPDAGGQTDAGIGDNHNKTEEDESYQCDLTAFMIWVSPVSYFGPREQLSVESLFTTHPSACLVFLSRSLDSEEGKRQVLQPFLDRDLKVLAVTPDIAQLFEGTPASVWYDRLQKGMVDPGRIPFSQNLSNLMRLVALYKYGGVYMDSDIIVLRNFSQLGNTIGSQNSDRKGKWIGLNTAVMKFSKGHPLILECIQEFADTFDGNTWGQNGPRLVTRVLRRFHNRTQNTDEWQCDVLPPSAFYPVDWIHIPSFLLAPRNHSDRLLHISIVQALKTKSYTLHLWNKQTRGFKVQNGSILDTIFRDTCLICNVTTLEAAMASRLPISRA